MSIKNFVNFIENLIQHKFEIRDLDETLPTIVFDTLYKNLITKNTSTDNLDV